jgi:hypothetical protein
MIVRGHRTVCGLRQNLPRWGTSACLSAVPCANRSSSILAVQQTKNEYHRSFPFAPLTAVALTTACAVGLGHEQPNTTVSCAESGTKDGTKRLTLEEAAPILKRKLSIFRSKAGVRVPLHLSQAGDSSQTATVLS